MTELEKYLYTLKKKIKETGLTQSEFSLKVGIDKTTLNYTLNGKSGSIHTLKKIEKTLEEIND